MSGFHAVGGEAAQDRHDVEALPDGPRPAPYERHRRAAGPRPTSGRLRRRGRVVGAVHRLYVAPRFEETAATLRQALTGEGGGYAVLRLGNLANSLGTGDDRFLRLATAFAAEVAVPFSPFPRWPLWKDIGVKVEKDPGKSSGIGYNAFHMDLVNATLPPDYTTLLCVRSDPFGGGRSILSDVHAAAARLSEDNRALLAEPAFHYGTFFDLFGVGEEYKPFPIPGR
ncbi:TauD/TfdA family dioxygenase [Streptomyces sp. NRRL B-3648]|uniref:TauD/TfdA family dioxygenase n=1 Tax=Streptomyces sp. NRRL B-3648 TaxID=1519493 RepID=UPI001F26ACD5|nr:TauD/TfdA family dioxygenase [Streptomyces sp. NRRL B-3648]